MFVVGTETARALDLELVLLFGEEGDEVVGEVGGEVFCLASLAPASSLISLSLSLFSLSLSLSLFQFGGNRLKV